MASTSHAEENRSSQNRSVTVTRRQHHYQVGLEWTGNKGTGTSDYRSYSRDHNVTCHGKVVVEASSDPAFRGDASRWNPEEFLVSALSSCHMLAYLHLCAVAGVIVVSYSDQAEGTMLESGDGGGDFTQAVLHPIVTVARGSDKQKAFALHHEAHEKCFIARSVNFPVQCEPQILEA